jgi:hypothetical protein
MLLSLSIGLALAIAVSIYALLIGLDADRAFYSTVLVIVASYYVLFAVMGGSTRALVDEVLIAALFLLVASLGFRRNMWLVVAGLAAHGVLDLFHGSFVANDGVPSWWPVFCMSYDLAASGLLAWTLHRSASLSRLRVPRLP